MSKREAELRKELREAYLELVAVWDEMIEYKDWGPDGLKAALEQLRSHRPLVKESYVLTERLEECIAVLEARQLGKDHMAIDLRKFN